MQRLCPRKQRSDIVAACRVPIRHGYAIIHRPEKRETGASMQCTECGEVNPAQARFCIGCGTRLASCCASCHAPNPPHANFCASCGTPLTDKIKGETAKRGNGETDVISSQLSVPSPQHPTPNTQHLERTLAAQAA